MPKFTWDDVLEAKDVVSHTITGAWRTRRWWHESTVFKHEGFFYRCTFRVSSDHGVEQEDDGPMVEQVFPTSVTRIEYLTKEEAKRKECVSCNGTSFVNTVAGPRTSCCRECPAGLRRALAAYESRGV